MQRDDSIRLWSALIPTIRRRQHTAQLLREGLSLTLSSNTLRDRTVPRVCQLGAYAISQAVELGAERGGEPRA